MTDGSHGPTTTRRRALTYLGTGAVALTAGCSQLTENEGEDEGAEEDRGDPEDEDEGGGSGQGSGDRDRTDIVEAGADDGGSNPINDVLERVLEDGTEVYFPSGEYLLDPVSFSGDDWALVGEDATLLVPGSVDGSWLELDGTGWTVEGFTVDLTADGASPANYLLGSDWTFRDVEFVGRMGRPEAETDFLLQPAVESDATGTVENVAAADGSAGPEEFSNRGLTWFGQNNRGKLTFRSCYFSGWANNTVYSESDGPLVLEECVFENTNVGARIGGGTVVRDCTWIQDGPVPGQLWSRDREARGLWINTNDYIPGEIVVENCEFVMTGPDATSAINAANPLDGITIRNVRIEQVGDQSAITLPGDGATTVRRTSITGDAEATAVDLSNRPNSSLQGLCVQQPGDGVRISDASGCEIVDSTINVTGDAFDFRNARVSTSNVGRSGQCPSPDG